LIRPSALGLAALMAAPALYQGFVAQTLDVQMALARFLIAVPVAALMLAGLRFLTASYRRRPLGVAGLRADKAAAPSEPPPS
jgi:hypothetical protein